MMASAMQRQHPVRLYAKALDAFAGGQGHVASSKPQTHGHRWRQARACRRRRTLAGSVWCAPRMCACWPPFGRMSAAAAGAGRPEAHWIGRPAISLMVSLMA